MLLMEHLMMLMEYSMLLQPRPGISAPNRWKLPPGMESHVTTLYLDGLEWLQLSVSAYDMSTPCDVDNSLAASCSNSAIATGQRWIS